MRARAVRLRKPVVLRHRLRLARLQVGAEQEKDVSATLRQHYGIVQSYATRLCDHERAHDRTEHPGQQDPLDHKSLDSFANDQQAAHNSRVRCT